MSPLFKRTVKPQFCLDYLAAAKKKLSWKTPVSELRFVVLDTETSGLNVTADRMLSLALFEVVNGQILVESRRRWTICQPGISTTPATAIHGILPSETRTGTDEKQVIEELLPILTGAIVVGHHTRFDARMIHEAMMRHFKTRFSNRILDTALIAMNQLTPFHQTGYANQRPPSLDEICAHFDLPVFGRHTAECDAFLTAQVFLLLSGRIRRRLINRSPQLRDFPLRKF